MKTTAVKEIKNKPNYHITENRGQTWRLLYANVRGLKSKLNCTKNIFEEAEPDIALFSETHLTENKGMKIEGYTYFGRSRSKGKGGGVGIFVKDEKKGQVAPHYSDRELEILWVSVHRKEASPLFIGVYYGKQETTCHKNVIQQEMDNLSAEIMEMRNKGEVVLCMDANAKIGLMGEPESRNGKLIQKVFQENEIQVMNGGDKCKGEITRQNRKNDKEKSAIDFVAASYQASNWINTMVIDEIGEYRMRGVNESDHNTIVIDIAIPKVMKQMSSKKTSWNIKASEEKFVVFRKKLADSVDVAEKIMSDTSKSITVRYQQWEKLLYKAAISTIGKTTTKNIKNMHASKDLKKLRSERRLLKKEFERETCPAKKGEKMQLYIQKQQDIREKQIEEEKERVSIRFEKMKEDKTRGGIWKERNMQKKDDSVSWLITKGKDGNRIFDPDQNKENIADFYENLYTKRENKPHKYHEEVKKGLEKFYDHDAAEDADIEKCPTKKELKETILKKKNRKSTTDWKNEILKRGGDEMVDFMFPVLRAFWQEETPPKPWNEGIITSIWKGKGDRERLDNQRGITTSSAVGTAIETLVFNRAIKRAIFTQAQAGGRKGASTADQVFILRNIISIAQKEKRKIIVTFYDVVKAYDKADMEDMMYSIGKSNVKGKILRLMLSLNVNLTAKVNTKAGLTREIKRDTGGKQGGKLIVPLFAKMMDNLAEDMLQDENLGIYIQETKIPSLLFVDDAISFAEGYQQQEKTLEEVHQFSLKHKLEWGPQKCKTMEIGSHKEERNKWQLGEDEIEKCEVYKYLGEMIRRDGKNDDNLEARLGKVKQSVRAIITCCKSDIMKPIGTKIMFQLHEAETLPALLYNAETWTLSAAEKKSLDQMEIYAWKQMLGLPKTTPNAAVIHTTGSLYTSIRVEMKQLIFLHKVLTREEGNWTKTTLYALRDHNTGWAKQADETLQQWVIETNWTKISQKSKNEWKAEVKLAAEKRNTEKLKDECLSKSRGETRHKTKTKHLIDILDDPNYKRAPDTLIQENQSIVFARALIMGRFGMLKCANNFSHGSGGKLCKECAVIDDEDHRINYCKKWETVNLYNAQDKIAFDDIYSKELDKCEAVINKILSVWDLDNGKNDIRA